MQLKISLPGMNLGGFKIVDFAYVDDESILFSNDEELKVIFSIFDKFSGMSGALMNWDKCKIMGLGQWKGRSVWPLKWLKSVDSLRIFGFHWCCSYKKILEENWNEVAMKVKKVLFSWSSRLLTTIRQRIFVAHTFILSLVWYKAQVLPLPPRQMEEIRAQVGSFLWKGWLHRVHIDALKLPLEKGGMNLTDISVKADALLLRNSARLISLSPGSPGRQSLLYWIGLGVSRVLPGVKPALNAEILVPCYTKIKNLFISAVPSLCSPTELEFVTTKMCYAHLIQKLDVPKIQRRIFLSESAWSMIWRRLSHDVLPAASKDILWRLIHNVLPTKERLLRYNKVLDANCDHPRCSGVTEDVVHYFCRCTRSADTWNWVRWKCLSLAQSHAIWTISDRDLIILNLPQSCRNIPTIIWLIATYVEIAYTHLKKRGAPLKVEFFLANLHSRQAKHLSMRSFPIVPFPILLSPPSLPPAPPTTVS